jgi:AcrR family transcriptional regulator
MPEGSPSRPTAAEPNKVWVLPTHQQRSRRNRDSLLKAGERVFAARGFSDAHVSEIARLAGCSIGSFYRRFKDKQALFLALQAAMYDQAHANIERFFAHPAGEKSSLTRVFFYLIENSATEAGKIKGYYRALFEISLRGAKIWDRMRELERFQAEHLRLLLARRKVRVRPDFIPAVAATIRVITENHVSMLLHGPGPFEYNDFASNCEFTRILLGVAGVEIDEKELKRLKSARAKAH